MEAKKSSMPDGDAKSFAAAQRHEFCQFCRRKKLSWYNIRLLRRLNLDLGVMLIDRVQGAIIPQGRAARGRERRH